MDHGGDIYFGILGVCWVASVCSNVIALQINFGGQNGGPIYDYLLGGNGEGGAVNVE
jgi:hypothetical protein